MFASFVLYDKTVLRSMATGRCLIEDLSGQNNGDTNIGVINVQETPYEVDDWTIDPDALEAMEEFPCDFYAVASRRTKSPEELDAIREAEIADGFPLVDAERDRRTSAGFDFIGKHFQARPVDVQNITGASVAAAVAVMNGAQPGNLRWSDANEDFRWIAADNSTLAMDAQTTILFGQSGMAHVSAHVFAGRSIKDRLAAGETLDITDAALWP